MANYRYEDFAGQYLGFSGYSGKNANVKVLCLFHPDKNPSMSFHLDKGQYFCFSCGAKGGIFSLARKVGLKIVGTDYIEELDDESADLSALVRSLAEINLDEEPPNYLPESTLRRTQRARTDYWGSRDILPDTCKAWQLGFDRMRNAVTIPIRETHTDQLIGITYRSLIPNYKPKYLDPTGYKKSEHLFGTWMDMDRDKKNPKRVVLCEGPLDAIKVWQAGFNGRAILGSNLTKRQVQILLQYDVEDVVLFFDDDKAGFKVAMSAYGRLHRRFNVTAAKYPTFGDDWKDPGSMTDVGIRNAIKNEVNLTALLPI